jgi:hypothetical protein
LLGTILSRQRSKTPTQPFFLLQQSLWGHSVAFVNQKTLKSHVLDRFPAPLEIQEDFWYRISSTTKARRLAVAINSLTRSIEGLFPMHCPLALPVAMDAFSVRFSLAIRLFALAFEEAYVTGSIASSAKISS